MAETTRRKILGGAFAGLTATACAGSQRTEPTSSIVTDGAAVTTNTPIVETSGGQVKGYRRNGVAMFKGIPYAGAPSGQFRFRAAPPLEPWTGTRNAFSYGPVCPIIQRPGADLSDSEWPFLIRYGPETAPLEDCLRINVWSPAIDTNAKRPVMLWLHAGGFSGGSSQKYLSTDGENLARSQDVVVASFNHRVGPLGFTNLVDVGGPDFTESANVGMLDIIAALQWVQTNIAAFGGDPGNVTVFGESGGGFKISVLLAMPAAQGLFHKAIIQSGARLRVHDPEASAGLTDGIFKALELTPGADAVRKIQDLPVSEYLSAAAAASTQLREEAPTPRKWAAPGWWYEPTAGVAGLPTQPCDPDAPAIASKIPLICGTVLNEDSPSVDAPELENIGWQDVEERLTPNLGDTTSAAIAAARDAYPSWKPIEVLSVLTGRRFRLQAFNMCERVARRGSAPVYNYIFSWQTPLFEGRPRAFHTSEVAFAFANTDLVDTQTGGGTRPRELARKMSAAWAAFARTGDPNCDELPNWPAFSPTRRTTMIFDDDCKAEENPDGKILAALKDHELIWNL